MPVLHILLLCDQNLKLLSFIDRNVYEIHLFLRVFIVFITCVFYLPPLRTCMKISDGNHVKITLSGSVPDHKTNPNPKSSSTAIQPRPANSIFLLKSSATYPYFL